MRAIGLSGIRRYESLLADTAAECRRDPAVRAELDADPRAFFAERGVEIPDGATVRVADDTADTVHLVMPPNSSNAVYDEALTGVAGGAGGPAASAYQYCSGYSQACVVSTASSMREQAES